MNFKQIALPFLLSLMVLISACKPDDPIEQESKIIPEITEVNAAANGGTHSIAFTIENPKEGAQVEAKTDATWIHITSADATGIIFDVAVNNNQESRTDVIDIFYGGVDMNTSITVIQAGAEVVEDASFEFEITSLTEVELVFNVLPKDKDIYYIYFAETLKFLEDSGVETDQDIIDNDMKYFIDEAEMYGISLEENVMDYYAYKGDVIGASFLGATPGTDYVIYAYGFEFVDGEMNIITELCKLQVTTKDVEVADAFMGVDVTVNGVSATVSYDAGDYDGRYFAFVEDVTYLLGDGEIPAEEDIPAIVTDIWYEYLSLYLQYGFSIEMLFGEFTQMGSAQVTYDLYANSTWVAAALPIDERGVAIAHPTVEVFETETVEPSDNQIDIEVYDIQARKAYVTLTPSNDDVYVFACMSSQYLSGMDDEEILNFIIESYYYNLTPISGPITYELQGITPDTEYQVLAFGYSGGVATTTLFKELFTSAPEAQSDVSVTAEVRGIFDMAAVAAIDPNYDMGYAAFIIIDYIIDGDYTDLYYGIYKAASVSQATDDQIKESLMSRSPKTSTRGVQMLSVYDESYVITAVAVDTEGNVSRLYRSEPFTLVAGETDDPEYFFDLVQGQASVTSLSFFEQQVPVIFPVFEDGAVYESVVKAEKKSFDLNVKSSRDTFSRR
ncbi:MAG: BACON domain-containing protein [Bacteroidales bacterium]|nr:BACON domain-containing protein [Bacteroidales bacterium]